MPFQPIPGSKPLTISAAVAPPLVYCKSGAVRLSLRSSLAITLLHPGHAVCALVLLPPFHDVSPQKRQAISALRNCLAITAAILFARLPLCYHVPWSAGLTYILSLTGWYGASRVIDLFYISGRKTIPRRVKRNLREVDDTDSEAEAPEPIQEETAAESKPNGHGGHLV